MNPFVKAVTKVKKKKIKQITKNYLWTAYVSPFIRKRDCNPTAKCISCDKTITYETSDAGHFVPKSAGKFFYWNEDNIHAQCPDCNRFGSHDSGAIYYQNLCEKIGKDKTDYFLEIRHKGITDNRTLNEIRDYYKSLN